MTPTRTQVGLALALLAVLWLPAQAAQAAQRRLSGHRPSEATVDRQADRLPSSQTLHLSLGLALPQPDALKQFLSDVYNPASPNFRHFLKPGDFARRFGPSEADYQSVIAFAQGHGLKVNQTYPNRLVVSVSGPASAVEQAFNVRLFHYRHRDQSLFFAPDAEPSIDSALPIQHIGGLDNAVVPRPPLLQAGAAPQNIIIPSTGAGPFNTYISKDFRAAYAPGVPETGQGQSVALVEFDAGYEPSDIATYESVSGLAPVPLQNRLIGGYDGGTGSAEVEVALDVELAIAMAPGLSSVLVYEGGGTDELFNQIAVDDQALQTSVSWLYGSDATTDVIFQQMAAQGQSVFNAAGDWGSIQSNPGIYSYSIVGDPNITFVGGTLLGTTGPGGAWAQETTWMPGGGGISSYPIPSYQQSLSMAVNQGSTSLRNIPDVALTANYVLEVEEGSQFGQGGTSAATPLWAAFMALANQHAASLGLPAVGAANPAIYNIAKSPYYARDFHDIQDLSTNNPANPSQFSAVTGYDLATGWGSPNGAGLVADLSNPGVQRPSPGPSLTPSQTFTPTYTPTPAPTLVAAACGTNITVDGLLGDAAWAGPFTPVTKLVLGANNDSEAGYYKVRWDSQYLYVGFLVSPSSLFPAPQSLPWTGEAVELYLDMGNNRSASYEADDFQYIVGLISYASPTIFEKNGRTTGVLAQVGSINSASYSVELAIPWSTLGTVPSANASYGFDVGVDINRFGNARTGQLMWSGTANNYTDTSQFGTLRLGPACGSASATASPTGSATRTASPTGTATASPSPTASRTGTPSASASATRSASPSPSATPAAATATRSPSPTASPTPSRTNSPGAASATATRTASPATPATRTASPSPTMTRSATASPTTAVSATATPGNGCPQMPVLVSARNLANGCYQAVNSVSFNNNAGADAFLVVRLENGSGAAPSQVSYGGSAMNLFMNDSDFSGGLMQTWLLSAPAAGANPLVVDYAAPNCSWNLQVELYSGVDPNVPVGEGTFTQDTDGCPPTTFSTTTISQQPDDILSDFLAIDVLPPSMSLGSGQANFGFNTGCCDNIYGDYKPVGPAGQYYMTYTFSQCKRYSSQLLAINGVQCGSGQSLAKAARVPSPSLKPAPAPSLRVYPNPAPGPAATAAYQVGYACRASLALMNLAGARVGGMDLGALQAGSGTAKLDLGKLGPGLYFVVLLTDQGGGPKAAATFKLAVTR